MNKTALAIVIGLLVLAGGAFFWYSSSANHDPMNHTDHINQSSNKSETSTLSSQKASTNDQDKDKNLVEVFYLAHAPARAILAKVEAILEKFPEYKVVKYDFDSETSKQKIEEYGLLEHSPIAIFVAGVNSFKIDDEVVQLANFPKGDAFVPSLEGSWSYDDLEKILADPNKYKND